MSCLCGYLFIYQLILDIILKLTIAEQFNETCILFIIMILKCPQIVMAIYFTNAKIFKCDLVFDKKLNLMF